MVEPAGHTAIGIGRLSTHRQPFVERHKFGVETAFIDRIDIRRCGVPLRKRPVLFVVGHHDKLITLLRSQIHRKGSQFIPVRTRKLRANINLLALFEFTRRFVKEQYREFCDGALLSRNSAARDNLFVPHVAYGQCQPYSARLRRTAGALCIVFQTASEA